MGVGVTVTSISISPSSYILLQGGTRSYVAQATYSDGSTADISSTASWQSSNTGVAQISSSGLVTGAGLGTSTISASNSGVVSNLASLAVKGSSFSATSNLLTGRQGHTATLLPNGKVLVVGGYVMTGVNITSFVSTAELYDPVTGTWAATGINGSTHYLHTATSLKDGRVLVAGGLINNFGGFGVSEIYDPATGQWSTVGSPMIYPRSGHTATLLPNGKVLVAGGTGNVIGIAGGINLPAEIFDPSTGLWSASGSTTTIHVYGAATLLPNGKVLLAGGDTISPTATAAAEIYDPATGTWAATGSMTTPRSRQSAVLLANGKVLAVSGFNGGAYTLTAELYDPITGLWTITGTMTGTLPAGAIVSYLQSKQTATLLTNGQVLVVGSTSTPSVYNPATGAWSATPAMITSRSLATVTPLENGLTLVVGGTTSAGSISSCELFL